MKRILSIVLCAASVAAFGEETTVTNVAFSLYPVTSRSKETIVAISLRGMDGEPVAVSDLVKTANLTAGDKLYTFENGVYKEWTLEDGAWVGANKKYTMDKTGQLVAAEGDDPSTVRKEVGSGIWLVRKDVPTAAFTFYLYGKPDDKPQTAIVGGSEETPTINLVGNPTPDEVTLTAQMFTGATGGDRIEVPDGNGAFGRSVYTYNGTESKWKTTDPTTHKRVEGYPKIPANQGFWYVSTGSGFKISWSAAN